MTSAFPAVIAAMTFCFKKVNDETYFARRCITTFPMTASVSSLVWKTVQYDIFTCQTFKQSNVKLFKVKLQYTLRAIPSSTRAASPAIKVQHLL